MMLFSKKAKNDFQVDYDNLPEHIGIIMDGNGRWARKRGLPRSAGHREGAKTLEKLTRFAGDIGIKYITYYAFSTENWKRPSKEVESLMKLMTMYLDDYKRLLGGEDIRIRIIGKREGLSEEILKKIEIVENDTKHNSKITMNIAVNYGGREDILNAVKIIADKVEKGLIKAEDITEDDISGNLYTNYMPDPDLIIRPSGELRLSNFLMWQSAYSEFWFSDINWPDFTKEDFLRAISDFQKRNRRYGGV
jgi:undecaprenyl diphosphate synthase